MPDAPSLCGQCGQVLTDAAKRFLEGDDLPPGAVDALASVAPGGEVYECPECCQPLNAQAEVERLRAAAPPTGVESNVSGYIFAFDDTEARAVLAWLDWTEAAFAALDAIAHTAPPGVYGDSLRQVAGVPIEAVPEHAWHVRQVRTRLRAMLP